ncbi:hypothetical protein PTT_08842 [Pyrenophora teres f. teres 0-1]|uniref:Uncharacterized protein n=1 Tax=Pyrenophora teres f. teres (strain 0-1) TaxID=861557 RepID=E3RKQ5_PYRTT|nr:hypothetical protein PTT_08842 [Pyrenophora teres f. teres 0-1]
MLPYYTMPSSRVPSWVISFNTLRPASTLPPLLPFYYNPISLLTLLSTPRWLLF